MMKENLGQPNTARNKRRGNNFLLGILGVLIIILGCFLIYIAQSKQDNFGLISEAEINLPPRKTEPILPAKIVTNSSPEPEIKTKKAKKEKPATKQTEEKKEAELNHIKEKAKAPEPKKETQTQTTENAQAPFIGETVNYNYKVKPGDVVEPIAKRFGVRPDEIKRDNNISESKINAPGSLKIRIQALHVVEKGDRIIKLAKKYHLKPEQIRRANNLHNDNIQLGKRIVIPVS